MSALRSLRALPSWLLPLLFFLLTAPAVADSITIGSATYIGWGSWGNPSKAMLTLQLDTRGVIFDRYIPGLQYPLAFNVNVYGWMGRVETNPPTSILIDPPYFCPCETIVFTMSLIDTFPFRLANGQLFTPNSTITVALEPLPGQPYVQQGQTVNIVLTSQPTPTPEPASLLLFGSGLLGIAVAAWRRSHG